MKEIKKDKRKERETGRRLKIKPANSKNIEIKDNIINIIENYIPVRGRFSILKISNSNSFFIDDYSICVISTFWRDMPLLTTSTLENGPSLSNVASLNIEQVLILLLGIFCICLVIKIEQYCYRNYYYKTD
mgnify:CR=1 FL=1